MKALRIVSKNKVSNWWCKNCSKAHNFLIKVDGVSYCEECVPEEFKGKLTTVNQNREKYKTN